MVLFRQGGCIWAIIVVFWKSGFIRAKVVVFGQSCSILAKLVVYYSRTSFEKKCVGEYAKYSRLIWYVCRLWDKTFVSPFGADWGIVGKSVFK